MASPTIAAPHHRFGASKMLFPFAHSMLSPPDGREDVCIALNQEFTEKASNNLDFARAVILICSDYLWLAPIADDIAVYQSRSPKRHKTFFRSSLHKTAFASRPVL
jgi:hypothetical protein